MIWLLLTLTLLLTFILRNSCKVKQSQPMQKNVSGQVSIDNVSTVEFISYISSCGHVSFLKSCIQFALLIMFAAVEGWPSWRPRHRRGEVGEQCRCQTRQGPKQWVKRSVKIDFDGFAHHVYMSDRRHLLTVHAVTIVNSSVITQWGLIAVKV